MATHISAQQYTTEDHSATARLQCVFSFNGLPTVLQQNQWQMIGQPGEIFKIDIVLPSKILLNSYITSNVKEIIITTDTDCFQQTEDSYIIKQPIIMYGIRVVNPTDGPVFFKYVKNMVENIQRKVTSPTVGQNVMSNTEPTHNVEYGFPSSPKTPQAVHHASKTQSLNPFSPPTSSSLQEQTITATKPRPGIPIPSTNQPNNLQDQTTVQQSFQIQNPAVQQNQQIFHQHQTFPQQNPNVPQQRNFDQPKPQQFGMEGRQGIPHQQQQFFTNQNTNQHHNTNSQLYLPPTHQANRTAEINSFNHQTRPNELPQTKEQNYFPPDEIPPQAFKDRSSTGSGHRDVQGITPTEEEKLCNMLSKSIENGDTQQAKEVAVQLASMNSKLTVTLLQYGGITDNKPDFNILLKFEDKEEDSTGMQVMNIDPTTTIRMLKLKISQDYGFPPSVQRLIISDRLAQDNDTLLKCGVRSTGTEVYLYVISHKNAGVREIETQTDQSVAFARSRDEAVVNLVQPLNNMNIDGSGGARPRVNMNEFQAYHVQQDLSAVPGDIQLSHAMLPERPTQPQAVAKKTPAAPFIGWECTQCTYKNLPTFPGCKVCSHDRPADYQVPVNYVLTPEEKKRQDDEEILDHLAIQHEFNRKKEQQDNAILNYYQTMVHAQQKLLPNTQPIDCPICYTNFAAGEAVMLRECLHCFCKKKVLHKASSSKIRDCLAETIKASEDPEVKCPHNDDFPCPAVITGQEIEQLLSEEDFAKFLDRSLATAENRFEDSYHCQTANCKGWCIYEDEVNVFQCPICKQLNCLTCKAIHVNMTCKQYQDDLKIKSENDEAAKKTQEMLQKLIADGEAMNCPKCKIILQKKSGCDWMRCSMCLTEICWATRGPRWGPGGAGDTSAGCKCKLNGRRCTPTCGNCH